MSDTGTPTAPTDASPVATTADAPPATPAPEPEVDWKAEAEKQRAINKKLEGDNKKNAAALEQMRQASMTDVEKAQAIARQEGEQAARAELGGVLVSEVLRSAAAGRGVDVDALLEGVEPSRFVGADGMPDRAAITAWVEKIAPKRDGGFDLGQGARGNGTGASTTDLAGGEFEKALVTAVGGPRR